MPVEPFPVAKVRVEAVTVRCPYDGCTGTLQSRRTDSDMMPIPEFNRLRGTTTTCTECRRIYWIHEQRRRP